MIEWLKSWRPNQEQIAAAVRWLLVLTSGWAIRKGWIDDDQATMIIGIGTAVVPLVWSFIIKTQAAQVKAAAALPDVVVVAGPDAPPSVKALAVDPSVPNIEVLSNGHSR